MKTIRDIAIAAGVSRGSVDRALHGRPEVNESTRSLVLQKAEELGYTPNHIARALVRTKAIHVGVVVQSRHSESNFWLQIRAGVDAAAREIRGHVLQVSWHEVDNDIIEQRKTIQKLVEQKAGAIALAVSDPVALGETINSAIDSRVEVMTFIMDAPLSRRMWFIGQDFIVAGKLAGELMGQFMCGNGKVAVITGFHTIPGQRQRVAGFREELKSHYPAIQIVGVYENHNRAEEAYAVTSQLLRDCPDLGGIYVTSAGPFGAARVIEEAGRVNDVKLICFDIVDETVEYIKRGVIQASIGQDPFLQGYAVVQTLFDFLVNGRSPIQKCMFLRTDIVCRANIDYFLSNAYKDFSGRRGALQ